MIGDQIKIVNFDSGNMKIPISKIEVGRFTVREKLDEEHLKALAESLKEDGQWDPIIVRPKDGKYELIAGHYRFEAAKYLGWKEIEATVKDLSDEEADFLALKTNLMRKNMDEIEEAKIIKKIMDEYELPQREIAKKLGMSDTWVSRRLALVLKITDEVQNALKDGKISAEHASLISNISEEIYNDWKKKQNQFLQLILQNNWSRDETRKQLKRFLNDTIYTIGYKERNLDDFIKLLKSNEIKYLIDVRYSNESEKKPEFNGDILERELKRNGIEYIHMPQLGLPYLIQDPYKEGALSFECVKQWYRWHVYNQNGFDFEKFVDEIKSKGKAALMCMERYAKPMRDQKIHCHRDILADMILEIEKDGVKLFENRIDL